MACSAKSLRLLSFVHVVLGILAVAAGFAAMRVIEYHSGLFGMGIWLGCWVCTVRTTTLAKPKYNISIRGKIRLRAGPLSQFVLLTGQLRLILIRGL